MTLRKKTIVLIAVTFGCLIATIYAISQNVLMRSYARLEQEAIHTNVERLKSALDKEISSIDAVNQDWAAWDDTYEFIEDNNDAYIESNLIDGTFVTLELNLMVFINSANQVILAKAFDLENEEEVPLPESFQEHLYPDSLLLHHPDTESNVEGVLTLSELPMLISSRPILTSRDQGPIRGTLIMGRYLDTSKIEELAGLTRLSIDIHLFDNSLLPTDLEEVKPSLQTGTPIIIEPLDGERAAGYASVDDIYDNPSLILKINVPRDIYREGQNTINYFMVVLAIAGGVLALVILLFFHRSVLSRLLRFDREIDRIRAANDLLGHVSVTGSDELSHLKNNVNKTLESLRASEEKYRELVETASEIISTTDMEGNFVFTNPAFRKHLGFSPEEVSKINAFELVHPEDIERVRKEFNRLEAGKGMRNLEYRCRAKDGSYVDLLNNTSPLFDSHGNVSAVVTVTSNITAQKKAEAEKREMERKAQVTSRLASVGEMASGIAHEINNPLTSVIGFSELLMEKDLPEDLREDVETIHNGAKRVADIVKRLLTFARQHKPVRSCTGINEIIESTLALRKYALETSNIEVITMLDNELPWTVADAGQLQQVFLNIIVNAETEMKKAHGRGRLTIRTEQAGDRIRISFADDGPGIAGENLERIFDPFFTTKEVGEGTGLGLSLSRGIITEHNGELYAESEEGKGATFFVELPVVMEEEKVERVEEVEEAGKAVGGRILVVDDEPAILAFLKKLLGDEGYDVTKVGSGREALEMIKEQGYDLIICDIKMPGLSGTELYDELGGIAPSLQKRTIFTTGDVISSDAREFLKATGAPCVPKPFDTAGLKKEINQILDNRS